MRTSPDFCGMNGSVFPLKVLWKRISFIGAWTAVFLRESKRPIVSERSR